MPKILKKGGLDKLSCVIQFTLTIAFTTKQPDKGRGDSLRAWQAVGIFARKGSSAHRGFCTARIQHIDP